MNHRYRHSSSGGAPLGISLISAAAGAAITYFLYGTSEGAMKRRQIKEWANKAKKMTVESGNEVMDAAKEKYDEMSVLMRDRYDDLKEIKKDELTGLKNRIRDHWDEIRDDVNETIEKSKKKLSE